MLRNLNQSASGKRILGVPQAGILAAQIASETAEGDHGPGILYNESQDAGYAGKYLRAAVTNWPSTGTLFVYENGNFEADGLPDGLHTFGYDLYVDGVYDSASSFDVTVGALTLSALTTSNVTSSGCTASVSISNNAAGTLYLAAYPSDQTPTWTRPNWSGTPTYSDSDTDSGSGSTFQWSPDVSGLSAGQEYKLWAIWDDGTQSSNGPVASDAFTTSITGTLTVTETGSDTFCAAGSVLVKGTLTATETGSDTTTIYGTEVPVIGSLAAIESGADTFSFSGDIIVSGLLSAIETGSDIAAIYATEPSVVGSLSATESGADAANVSCKVYLSGAFAATEEGFDLAAIAGKVLVSGAWAATEIGADTAAFTSHVTPEGEVTLSDQTIADLATAIANALMAQLTAATLKTNMTHVNGTLISGAGTESNPWGGH